MMTETFFFFFFPDVKMAHDDFPISQMYYTPITCFLTFNICAVLGNLIPSILRFVSVQSWLAPKFPYLCVDHVVSLDRWMLKLVLNIELFLLFCFLMLLWNSFWAPSRSRKGCLILGCFKSAKIFHMSKSAKFSGRFWICG